MASTSRPPAAIKCGGTALAMSVASSESPDQVASSRSMVEPLIQSSLSLAHAAYPYTAVNTSLSSHAPQPARSVDLFSLVEGTSGAGSEMAKAALTHMAAMPRGAFHPGIDPISQLTQLRCVTPIANSHKPRCSGISLA
eukprot:1202410-Prymnesium_polylepis.2